MNPMKIIHMFLFAFISTGVKFVLNHLKVSCRFWDILLISSVLLQNVEVSGHGDLYPPPKIIRVCKLAHSHRLLQLRRLHSPKGKYLPPEGQECQPQGHHSQTLTLFGARPSQQQVVLVVKNPPVNAGDVRVKGSIPGWGRSPEEGHGNPLQYSCLENPMDRRAWWATVHGVTKSRTPFPQASIQTVSTLYPSYIPGCQIKYRIPREIPWWSKG